MRAFSCCLFLALACVPACAQDVGQPWNWYFIAFDSPSPGSGVFMRSGTARVLLSQGDVRIEFMERKIPELKATYVGSIGKEGVMKGQLHEFFPHGSEAWNGAYRYKILSGIECRFDEIVLRSGVPDGSALVITRTRGKCQ